MSILIDNTSSAVYRDGMIVVVMEGGMGIRFPVKEGPGLTRGAEAQLRKIEPSARQNGGPATPPGNTGITEGQSSWSRTFGRRVRRLLRSVIVATVMAVGTAAAQVEITSLDRSGTLTWTNILPDATYRIEWTSSPTSAWQSVSRLTNLLSIHATSSTVSVEVPMLYRVVWTDPPLPDPVGTFR